MHGSWLSVLPFLIAIVFPILTKQLFPGLVFAILTGSFLYTPSLLDAFAASLHAILKAMEKDINLETILFLYLFGGLLGMMQIAGGMKGFDQLAIRWIRTPRAAFWAVWLSLLITFVSPMFRIITIVPLLNTLAKRLQLSSYAVGIAVDTTTVPVITLLPFGTAFVGYMLSIVASALHQNQLPQDPFHVYLSGMYLNVFSWVMILYGIVRTLIRPHFPHLRTHDAASPAGNPLHTQGIKQELSTVTPRPWNLFVPLSMLICFTLYFLYRDGKRKGAHTLLEAWAKANATDMMLLAISVTLFLTFLFYVLRRQSFDELVYHFFAGGGELMVAIVLLLLVWSLGTVTQRLGFSDFIRQLVGNRLPGTYLPVIVFLAGALIAYFLGSSWGTWGILMPLAIPIAVSSNASLPLTVGAVFASGTFGSFASPLGDETVNTATLLGMQPLEYARWKLPIAVGTALVTAILYVSLGFLLR
jgi:Na+/H+ antiporter NhaC